MKKLILSVTIAALLIGSLSLMAWANPGAGWNHSEKYGKDGMFGELNLTLEQQEKMLAIRQDFQKDTLALRNDLRKKHLELRQLWEADSLKEAAINAKTKEVNALKIQMVNKMRAMREKIKGVLTAEQLKKLNDREQKHKSETRGQRRFGRGCFGESF